MTRKPLLTTLSPPSGPIKYKYSDFVTNDDFPEIGIVGPMSSAKTSAAMDRLIRRGMEYPGSNQLLARATLVALKDSSIIRLRQRGQGIFDPSVGGSENTQEGLFRFPKAAHPVTGAMVQSTITGIGLDRADLDVVFKSTEYAGGHLDEANEIPSDAHDFFQERCRQEIWHATRTVKDYCMRLATVWSEVSGKVLAWMDVYNILLDDPLNKVGELQLPPDHPEPGWTTVGASWNPVGNDHTWDRYVGVPYPMPAPSEQWVRDFVGVREVYVEPRELRDDHHTFRAGALIRLPDGSRNYTAKHEGGVVTLVDGSQYPDDQVGLVLQRYCIYAFGHENMSRDHRNVENTYLMVNKKMRKQHQHGHVDVREGRVTPAFVNEPLEYGGHIVPAIDMDRIARSGSLVVGGLDHGGDHPTAFVQGLWISHMNTIIIFDEYVQSGLSAFANATRIKERTIHGLSMVIGYDPAMNARTFDREANHRIIDNYIEVMGNQFVPGTAGPVAFDDLGRALEVQDSFLTDRPPVPGILVTENCEQVIHTMQNLTWKMVQNQRGNWMVDVGDALKLMRSVVKQGYAGRGASHVVAEPKLAYSDRWNDGSPIGGL